MPIYEFYCEDCNTIFSFFSGKIDTRKIPGCPKCDRKKLSRQMSTFAISGKAKEEGDPDDLPFDEAKMEKAMQMLAKEAGNMNEDDPKKTADLLRKLSQISGMELGDSMHEALKRIENGEDPEKIEAEMGNILDHEDPFLFSRKTKGGVNKKAPPRKDDTLYDL